MQSHNSSCISLPLSKKKLILEFVLKLIKLFIPASILYFKLVLSDLNFKDSSKTNGTTPFQIRSSYAIYIFLLTEPSINS